MCVVYSALFSVPATSSSLCLWLMVMSRKVGSETTGGSRSLLKSKTTHSRLFCAFIECSDPSVDQWWLLSLSLHSGLNGSRCSGSCWDCRSATLRSVWNWTELNRAARRERGRLATRRETWSSWGGRIRWEGANGRKTWSSEVKALSLSALLLFYRL